MYIFIYIYIYIHIYIYIYTDESTSVTCSLVRLQCIFIKNNADILALLPANQILNPLTWVQFPPESVDYNVQ